VSSAPPFATGPPSLARASTADDGDSFTAYNLANEFLSLPPVNITTKLVATRSFFFHMSFDSC
jgi:hypothetical protein